jgi:hypothetical protein
MVARPGKISACMYVYVYLYVHVCVWKYVHTLHHTFDQVKVARKKTCTSSKNSCYTQSSARPRLFDLESQATQDNDQQSASAAALLTNLAEARTKVLPQDPFNALLHGHSR